MITALTLPPLLLQAEADLEQTLSTPAAVSLIRRGARIYTNGSCAILTTERMDTARGWMPGGRIVIKTKHHAEIQPCAA